MKRITSEELGIEGILIISIMIAIGAISLLSIIAYGAVRYVTYGETLEEKATTAFEQFYDHAEQVILFHELESMTRKVVIKIDHKVVKNIQVYKLDESIPVWAYGNFHDLDNIKFYDFDIVGNQYPVLSQAKEFYTDDLNLDEKKIGFIRIAIATEVFQQAELKNGLLFFFFLFVISITAVVIVTRISKKLILPPISDIMTGLNRMGSGNLETPIHQTGCREFRQIQGRLNFLRNELLASDVREIESLKREQTHLQDRIDDQQYVENILRASNHFVCKVASLTLSRLNPVRKGLQAASIYTKFFDDFDKKVLRTAEIGAEEMDNHIHELMSMANLSILDVELNYSSINITEFLSSIIDGCSFPAKRKGVDLRYTLKSANALETDTLYSDRNKVETIITTIITHVILHSDKGSLLVESTICDETWCLTIMGTKSTIRESEFDMMNSTNDALDPEALDLSVALLLLQRMRGSVTAKCEKKSTNIEVTLPSSQKECISSVQIDILPFHSHQKENDTP